ncbi:MAG: hypothetical protein ABEH78_07645 [Haloferacaceae archaeon]
MRATDQFASVITSEGKTKMSPAVVVSTLLLILGFALALGYRALLIVG